MASMTEHREHLSIGRTLARKAEGDIAAIYDDHHIRDAIHALFPWTWQLRHAYHSAMQADNEASAAAKGLGWYEAMTHHGPESRAQTAARDAYYAALRAILLLDDINRPTLEQADPVARSDIAHRLQVEQQTVQNWTTRGILPAPRWEVGGRPAWSWVYDIEPWAIETGRLSEDHLVWWDRQPSGDYKSAGTDPRPEPPVDDGEHAR